MSGESRTLNLCSKSNSTFEVDVFGGLKPIIVEQVGSAWRPSASQ